MLLKNKAQSTAEYAILIGVVAAIAAGFLSVALKGGVRAKNQQAMNVLMDAGGNVTEWATAGTTTNISVPLYTQEQTVTKVQAAGFKDKAVMYKGGKIEKESQQQTATNTVSIETLDDNN